MNDEIEKKLWARVDQYLPYLRILPFIKMVAVCNNLAFGKVDEESDIDLFIVAKKGRLFTVRIFITVILHVLGVRRHGKKVNARFCLSFFVDEDFLDLSKIALEDDFYLAFWVRNLLPVIDSVDENGCFSERFLSKNLWIKDFFNEEDDFVLKKHVLPSSRFCNFCRKLNEIMFGYFWGDFFEFLMKKWQLKRASAKMAFASENAHLLVEEHILKFHNVDRRREYNLKWVGRYGKEAKLEEDKFLDCLAE